MQYKFESNKSGLLYLVVLLSIVFYSSTSFGQKKATPLFKLGPNEFYADEFEYYFSKNNDELTKDSVRFKVNEYLELYVKFRLKVLEAEAKKCIKTKYLLQNLLDIRSNLQNPIY